MVRGELAFPPSALAGMDVSPPFMWTGVPPEAKSLMIAFQDIEINAVKWLVWDIPPSTMMLPAGIEFSAAMPSEIPGSSQLGSLMRQGYGGPARPGERYEWQLFALDVEKLPNTAGKDTVQLFKEVMPMHKIAETPVIIVYNN